jgi:hypothetical protein
MSDHFGAVFTTVRGLFSERRFSIPDYQRGYAWGRQQWDELWEDLDLLPLGKSHYTGTIVLQATDRRFTTIQGNPLRVEEVVDGQQRLTTLVLLLDALRRELEVLDEHDLARGIAETYLFITDRNRQEHSKLVLASDVQDFFFTRILQDRSWPEGSEIRAQKNLTEAKRFFADRLGDKKSQLREAFGGWLLDFREKITEQLIVTVYPVGRESEAGVIFEVMNNRGKLITELEKVKNYLLYVASKLVLESDHDFARQVNDAWSHIFHRLMASGLASSEYEDQLLRVHWLMAYNPIEKDWNGSKSLKEKMSLRSFEGDHPGLLHALQEYVRGLRQACTAFCEAQAPMRANAFADVAPGSERDALLDEAERLPRLRNVAPFLPLLVAARIRFSDEISAYRQVLDRCERYAFRVFRIMLRRAQSGRSSLFTLAHRVYAGKIPLDAALDEIDRLAVSYAPEVEVRRELTKERDWYSWSALRYMLYEYEVAMLAKVKKRVKGALWTRLVESPATSIEHVLPQTAKDEYWTSRFDLESRERLTHDLGNLCLTLDNSVYGNKPFPKKKGEPGSADRCYCNGEFYMERDLARYANWTEETIRERRSEILDWALKRWEIEEVAGGPVSIMELLDEDEVDEPTIVPD